MRQYNASNNRGFTLTETMFVSFITMMVVTVIASVWIYTYKTWATESERTKLRVDLISALETIKKDVRLSSSLNMVFYPAGSGPYTGISLPQAAADDNHLFTLDSSNNIVWNKTIMYHLFNETDGTKTLRRTVIDPRNNDMTEAQRLAELESVVTNGTGGVGASTDTKFLKNVQTLNISSLSPIIDFYDVSTAPVRVGKVSFGWVKLTPGNHSIRFKITGKNSASTGYKIGIDNIMIEPAGGPREMEYYSSAYAPSGSLYLSAGTVGRVHSSEWSNENYLQFNASAVDQYFEITDYYDLWRESAFTNCSLDNAKLFDEEVRIALEVPEEDVAGTVGWVSSTEAGSETDLTLPGSGPPVVIRTVVTSSNISETGDFIRVNLKSSSGAQLVVKNAYITKRSGTDGCNGLANIAPGSSTPDQYHRHQQIFFKTGGVVTPGVTIPANGEVWSVWTGYPLGTGSDDLVTLFVEDISCTQGKGWTGPPGDVNSFYVNGEPSGWPESKAMLGVNDVLTTTSPHLLSDGDGVLIDSDSQVPGISDLPAALEAISGTPFLHYFVINSTANTFQITIVKGSSSDIVNFSVSSEKTLKYRKVMADKDIFILAAIDSRKAEGHVRSQIFDTTLDAPSYGEARWSENVPAGTDVSLKVRSSASKYMVGAADWDLIAGSSANPFSLAVGTGRYVQFQADLTSSVYWKTTSSSMTYSDYVGAQVSMPVYSFPKDSGESYFTAFADPSWVDDVKIAWVGETRICNITGYIAKKSDYGQAKIMVDGKDLTKIFRVNIKLLKSVRDRTINEENYVDIEPRNSKYSVLS